MALGWRAAWAAAVYGPGGFYARGEAPAAHFRTSVHASPLFGEAIGTVLERVDAALGRPDPLDVVDVGAGDGKLLAQVADRFGPRLRVAAVEVRTVDGVPTVRAPAELPPLTGLLVANEWLDDVPLDVVVRTPDGPRLVLVDADGTETAGPPPNPDAAAWLARWWPGGDRAEVGLTRDDAWAAAVGRIRRGVALAIDYGHEAADRPPAGTLTGYRGGRQVPPVPDGSRNRLRSCAI